MVKLSVWLAMATARSMAPSDSCTAVSKSCCSDDESGDSSASQHSRWLRKTRQQHAQSALAGRLAKAYERIRELELELDERSQREGAQLRSRVLAPKPVCFDVFDQVPRRPMPPPSRTSARRI